ncbi:hypothetical protein FRC18_004657 [Serendipita sp. 400]|nr:hypothetical protein FRC18_004657 [Serendipita sp. 400]
MRKQDERQKRLRRSSKSWMMLVRLGKQTWMRSNESWTKRTRLGRQNQVKRTIASKVSKGSRRQKLMICATSWRMNERNFIEMSMKHRLRLLRLIMSVRHAYIRTGKIFKPNGQSGMGISPVLIARLMTPLETYIIDSEIQIQEGYRRSSEKGRTPWWDLPSKAQIPALATAKGALIFSKEVADGVLRIALGVVEAQDFIVCKGAMQLAHTALDEAQRCGATAIRIADEALALTDRLTTELVANANKALEGARWLGNTAVDAADGALVVAEKSSIVIIAAAQALVDGLTSCAEWTAYQAASAAVAAAKEAGSDALLLAKVGAKIGTAISQFAMKAWQWILLHLTSFVDIREIVLSAQLGKACGGAEFDASIKGTMADDHFFDFHISFSTAHTTEFITAIFDKLVDMIEDGFLEGGKAITAVAQGLSGDLVKSLQEL